MDAILYSKEMISESIIEFPYLGGSVVYIGFLFAIYLVITEWIYRDKDYSLQQKASHPGLINLRISDFIIVTLIILFGNIDSKQFIYFQF
jgi:hypothetical protein